MLGDTAGLPPTSRCHFVLLQRPGLACSISGFRRHLALLHDPSWVGAVDEARFPRVGRRAMQLSGSLHQSTDMTLCTATANYPVSTTH